MKSTDTKAGRHFGFLKKAGRHQKGAGRRALQKRPRQNTAPYTTTTYKQPTQPNTSRYPHPKHLKLEHSHQQDCTESKHNFSLPPQKHSHMPTQNQTPSLHNTSTYHLRICQHHLGSTIPTSTNLKQYNAAQPDTSCTTTIDMPASQPCSSTYTYLHYNKAANTSKSSCYTESHTN